MPNLHYSSRPHYFDPMFFFTGVYNVLDDGAGGVDSITKTATTHHQWARPVPITSNRSTNIQW